MAARVNTKLILITFIIFASLASMVAVAYVYWSRTSATRSLAAGDQYIAEENYRDAFSAYGRALVRDPSNLEYTAKREGALLKITPETREDADALYGSYIATLAWAAEHHPADGALHVRYLDELLNAASRTGQSSFLWQQLAEAAGSMMNHMPATAPDYVEGLFYRGVAAVAPEMRSLRTADEVAQGEQDLENYVQARPERGRGWGALIESALVRARNLHTADETSTAGQALIDARSVLARAQERAAGEPEVMIAELHHMVLEESILDTTPDSARFNELVAQAEAVLIDRGDSFLTGRLIEQVMRARTIVDAPQPVDLADRYVAAHADAIDLIALAARLHYYQRDWDRTERAAEDLLDTEPLTVCFLARIQWELKLHAQALSADAAYGRLSAVPPGERAPYEAVLEERVNAYRAMSPNPELDLRMTRLDGKLALTRGDLRVAAARFDQLVRETAPTSPDMMEYLQLAAFCHERQGNIGAATRYVQQALGAQPGNVSLMERYANLLIRQRSTEAAAIVRQLLELNPENEEAKRLANVLALREVRGDATSDDPVMQAVLEVREYLNDGDADSARASVNRALEDDPENLTLLNAAVRIEIFAEQPDAAQALIDRALDVEPGHMQFLALQTIVENPDPIERLQRYIELVFEDPDEAGIQLLRNLYQLRLNQQTLAATREEEGDTTGAAEAQALVDRAHPLEVSTRAEVQQRTPDAPEFIEYLFMVGAEEEDWDALERLVARAGDLNADEAGGAVYRGRYAGLRGEFEDAIREFRAASRVLPYSAVVWNLLAVAHQRNGDNAAALDAYAQAYENNPTNVQTLKSYVRLLILTGDHTQALIVLRRGQQVAPNDTVLRDAWLAEEAEIGDEALALKERLETYSRQPEDRANAISLAIMLSSKVPNQRTILAEDGSQSFSPRTWETMGSAEQERAIAEVQQRWYAEANQIVLALNAPEDRGFGWHILRADTLRLQGDVDAGEAALLAYEPKIQDDADRVAWYLARGRFERKVGRLGAAAASFEQARAASPSGSLDADKELAQLAYTGGEFEAAAQHLERALAVERSHELCLLAAECFYRLERYDDARSHLDYARQLGEDLFAVTIQDASVTLAEGNSLWRDRKTDEADEKFQAFERLLDEALVLRSTDPLPHVLRAQGLLKAYQRTQETVLLDDALRALSLADEASAGAVQTSLVRASVLGAMNDRRAAILELTRVLQRIPDSDEARRPLVQMLLEQGDIRSATTLLEEAIARRPGSIEWRERLADLQVPVDPAQAVLTYQQALGLIETSSPQGMQALARLSWKLAGAMMAQDPPDYEGAVAFIHTLPEGTEADLRLHASYAQALAGSGDLPNALQHMRVIHARQRAAIDAGEARPESIHGWFATLRKLFPHSETAAAEAAVLEILGEELGIFELRGLSQIWLATGAGGFERAAELQQQALDALNETNEHWRGPLLHELGMIQLAQGRKAEAAEVFARVTELNPAKGDAHNNAGYLICEVLNDPQRALPHARRAVELRPSDPQRLDTLGCVLFRLGETTEAEEQLRLSLSILPTASANLHLAHVFFGRGDLRQAQQYLERAEELRPDPETLNEINELQDDIRKQNESQNEDR